MDIVLIYIIPYLGGDMLIFFIFLVFFYVDGA